MTRSALFALLLATAARVWAQEPAPVPAAEPAVPDDGVRVAVLGYHDMGEHLPETAMRIHTSKFRRQMETIRQLGIPVIPMEQFIAWKKDGKDIPKAAIVLTFDDGWKSVYTDAYPILKEFGFPFTVFLYKNYVDGGGKALSSAMIEEMKANGASIGSHSVSHPYPVAVKNVRKKGAVPYDAYLRKEMGESKRFLEDKFRVPVTTYAYPGGFYTEEMLKLGGEFGYTQLFTVLPGKVKRDLPDVTLPRYIILGNYDKIFDMAVSFREGQMTGTPVAGPDGLPVAPATPYPVAPEAGAIVNSRLPEISADLSQVPDLDPASLVMKVAGFGEVPATFIPDTGKFFWQVNRRLREPTCSVLVSWKDKAGKPLATPLRWSFKIDRESAYLPDSE